MLCQLHQLNQMLDLRHTQVHSMRENLVHLLLHRQRNPMYPNVFEERKNRLQYIRIKWMKDIFQLLFYVDITESPPDANDILGMSCFAIVSLLSRFISDKNLLDTHKIAFKPASVIFGVSDNACCIRRSQRRFFVVFKPAASQTRFIHSLRVAIELLNYSVQIKNSNQFEILLTWLLMIVVWSLALSLRF